MKNTFFNRSRYVISPTYLSPHLCLFLHPSFFFSSPSFLCTYIFFLSAFSPYLSSTSLHYSPSLTLSPPLSLSPLFVFCSSFFLYSLTHKRKGRTWLLLPSTIGFYFSFSFNPFFFFLSMSPLITFSPTSCYFPSRQVTNSHFQFSLFVPGSAER